MVKAVIYGLCIGCVFCFCGMKVRCIRKTNIEMQGTDNIISENKDNVIDFRRAKQEAEIRKLVEEEIKKMH